MNKGTKQAFQYVIPKTIPVLVGYLFLGAAYGILMQVNGFGIGWTLISSIFIYAGSLQYLEVTLLVGLVSPVYTFLIGLMINARHLFYGISLLNKYRDVKKGKPYLIFALTDETFSVICDENVPETLEQDKVFFWITFLDQCYWVMGSAMGALVGGFLTFNTQGLDFCIDCAVCGDFYGSVEAPEKPQTGVNWTAWICSLCGGLWSISFSYSGDACDHSGFDLWI